MGAAALHLAKEDTRTIAIVGGGFQGRTQLGTALLVARPQTREIRIYDVNRAQAENFARHMEKRTGRKVAVCATVDETDQRRGHRRDRHGKHRAPAAAAPSGAGDALHPRGRQRMRV